MKGHGQNIHELTRVEAFLLSEKAGHPSHMHDYFWAQAEGIVRQRIAIVDHAKIASRDKKSKVGKVAKPKPKPAAVKAVATSAKPKAVNPGKKKAAPALAKADPKKTAKSK